MHKADEFLLTNKRFHIKKQPQAHQGAEKGIKMSLVKNFKNFALGLVQSVPQFFERQIQNDIAVELAEAKTGLARTYIYDDTAFPMISYRMIDPKGEEGQALIKKLENELKENSKTAPVETLESTLG